MRTATPGNLSKLVAMSKHEEKCCQVDIHIHSQGDVNIYNCSTLPQPCPPSPPGGGTSTPRPLSSALGPKRLELLCELVPKASTVAVLVNPNNLTEARQTDEMLNAARNQLREAAVLQEPRREERFTALADASTQMLLVLSSPHFVTSRSQIVQLAVRHRLPTMFIFKTYVQAGELLSYGADYVAMHRQAATQVAKILKGTKVGDIPIEQPNRFEFVVNLKTAKAIGLDLPTSILLRADEVIE